jgi:hypothetical protein
MANGIVAIVSSQSYSRSFLVRYSFQQRQKASGDSPLSSTIAAFRSSGIRTEVPQVSRLDSTMLFNPLSPEGVPCTPRSSFLDTVPN